MQRQSTTTLASARVQPTFAMLAMLALASCGIGTAFGYGQAVVLGIVQGLAEFLPISSSAHLILVPWFFGWQGGVLDSLSFDVALHLGTLVAVVVYFWADWLTLLQAVPGVAGWGAGQLRGQRRALAASESLLLFIVIATIPAGIFGVLLDSWAEHSLRNPLLIAGTLPLLGILLYVVDRIATQSRPLDTVRPRDALLIGLAQSLAIIPGVSRAGATITMGRFLGFDRASAARCSFLLSAPIIGAAVLLKLPMIVTLAAGDVGSFAVGTLVAASVGALAIHTLLDYIRRASFAVFTVYRILLALAIVGFALWVR